MVRCDCDNALHIDCCVCLYNHTERYTDAGFDRQSPNRLKFNMLKHSCYRFILTFLVYASFLCAPVTAGNIINAVGLSGGVRWDAAPQMIGGNERSLDGGIRYSMSGGSYLAMRDSFTWQTLPSESEFELAITQAFNAWTVADPVTGLTTKLNFVADLQTAVVRNAGFGSLNPNGAEIDLLASDSGSSGFSGLTTLQPAPLEVMLTSGTMNYASSQAIAGVDLHLNSNVGAAYTLDIFRRLLTHEIGHAIGLGDVDLGGEFIDDNFDTANPTSTLTNPWAQLVDPLNPAGSTGLNVFSIAPSTFSNSGVDILMESGGLGTSTANPLNELFPLRNDDYGARQFLYPSLTSVPEPRSFSFLVILLTKILLRRKRLKV